MRGEVEEEEALFKIDDEILSGAAGKVGASGEITSWLRTIWKKKERRERKKRIIINKQQNKKKTKSAILKIEILESDGRRWNNNLESIIGRKDVKVT